MKRFLHLILSVAAVGLLTLGFTSCDDDDDWYDPYYNYPYANDAGYDNGSWWNKNYADPSDTYVQMANALRGHWSGSLEAIGNDSNGRTVTYNYTTDVEFDQYQQGTVFGRGRQQDYITDAQGNLQLSYDRRFTWHIDVQTGNIWITYDASNGQSNYTMVIPYEDSSTKYGGFHLDATQFYGSMIAEDNTELDNFDFQRYTLAKKTTLVKTSEDE